MAENLPQSVEVPVGLAIFGSRVTEMAPSDLPEGVSPDNQDVAYLPGDIRGRPGLHRLFAMLPNGANPTYTKTFVQPNGQPLNLILDSLGNLWQEDVINHPNVLTLVGTVSPGSYCESVTVQGREYFAFFDGIKGTDIPRQYDGKNFDRVSQDACGGNATFQNVPVDPPVEVLSALGATHNILTITPVTPIIVDGKTIFQFLGVACSAPHGLVVGTIVRILGNTETGYNCNAALVVGIPDSSHFHIAFNSTQTDIGTGGTVTLITGSSIVDGVGVFIITSPLQLQPGNQVKITGSASVDTNITKISIANNIATFTADKAHGLTPGAIIQYFGPGTQVAATITSVSRTNNISTVQTAGAHGLGVGVPVNIVGVANATFDVPGTPVLAVIDDTHFTYQNIEADATSTGGSVLQVWPLNPSTYFTVDSVTSATEFTVSILYPDSTWAGGFYIGVTDGIYYIKEKLSNNAYSVKVPNWINTYLAVNTESGFTQITLTPNSQIAPGQRQMVTLFETRTGLVVGPCTPVDVDTSGSGYAMVSRVPIGPGNTIRRIIAFTGVGGANFFYLPVPGFLNGIQVSTSTVIEDNVSTVAIFDFSDRTLFDGIAIDIPGNDLFASQVLGNALSVSSYASRLLWWKLPNKLPNLINMGFDGGYYDDTPNAPLGWEVVSNGFLVPSLLTSGGLAWVIPGGGSGKQGQIRQTAYKDFYGAAIVKPDTQYTLSFWTTLTGLIGFGFVEADISSVSGGWTVKAAIGLAAIIGRAGFFTATFNAKTPLVIPPDTVFTVYGVNISNTSSVLIDELSIVVTDTPYVLPALFSYIKNLETYNGETGYLGPTDDDTPIQAAFTHRDALHFLTARGLHETQDSAQGEPYSWSVREISLNCGAAGPRAASLGENFAAWVSSPSINPGSGLGLYVYTGGNVYKCSQEIQPDFDTINKAAQSSICVLNDPVTRRIYIGVPTGAATAPNAIFPLDYRELDVASDIVNRAPVHISYTGKMICSDMSRKWTIWNITPNCFGIIARPGGDVEFVIGGGNGQAPGISPTGFGGVYYLDELKYTDDDYGQINPYYVTYFFINHEAEQALQVGLHRKLFKRWAAYVAGIGRFQITPYSDSLNNPYPTGPLWPLTMNPLNDIGDGLNVDGERCAFKIASLPLIGQTDNFFACQKLIITLMQHPVSPIRYGAI